MSLRPPDKIVLNNLDFKSFSVWLDAFKDYAKFAKFYTSDELKADTTLETSLFLAVAGLDIRNLVNGLTHDGSFAGIINAIK